MRKIILIFSLLFTSSLGYCQLFKTVKIDSLVSVSLPPIYTVKDTLGQQTFSARSSFGFMVVTRIPNVKNNAPLKKENDLKKVFKNYVADVRKVGNGSIVNERDTTVGALKGHVFTLKTEDDGGNYHSRNFLFLYTQDVSYAFQYFYDDVRADMTRDEAKTFFSSVKLAPDLQRNDQYLATDASSSGLGISQILMYGGGLLVILVIVFTIIRRRKVNSAA